MSEFAFEAGRTDLATLAMAPQTEEQNADMRELSMDELDEANGGLLPLLAVGAFLAGYGAMSLYYDRRGR